MRDVSTTTGSKSGRTFSPSSASTASRQPTNYGLGLPVGLIYADSKGMLKDRVASLREANVYEEQRYRHVLGAPLILKEEGGVIEAETSFLVVRVMREGQMILFASGRYIDRVLVQSVPVFAEKIVVCDSSRIDTLLAIPL
jgi:anthranilate 1,2-dioxygenase small subunit